MYMMDLTGTRFEQSRNRLDTVLVPIGMIEAHGPHCSLGTDMLIPREFVRRLDAVVGERVLMAPEIPYGHSFNLAPFAGTIDVSGQAFAQYVLEIGKGFLHQGFGKIILFNGHGGNIPSLTWVSEQLSDVGAVVLSINWWADYRATIREYTPGTGHAGEDETSVLMAIDPRLVEMVGVGEHVISVPTNLKAKNIGKEIYPDAYSGNAGASSADKGEQILQALLPLIVRDIEAMWAFSDVGR